MTLITTEITVYDGLGSHINVAYDINSRLFLIFYNINAKYYIFILFNIIVNICFTYN